MLLAAIVFLLILMLFGMPLYLVIATGTLIAFNWDEPLNFSIFIEMFRLNAPTLLAIPLFTFSGFVLAASKAPTRIVNLSNAFLGWLPGGLSIVAVISCAILTAFTGASGVTIIALGGLLLPSLLKQGYKEPFSIGLLTTAGSRGLLFPPSLPLILYGVVTKLSIDNLFKSCLTPGLLGILFMAGYCMVKGKQVNNTEKQTSLKTSLSVLKSSWAELPLPIIVLGGIYAGFITVTEAACISALYVLIVEVIILKEISFTKELPKITCDSMVMVGSVLIILAAALGFTGYLVDEEIPMKLVTWMKSHIHSRFAFLIFLNLILLIVGCIMDIFSAIIIVVPLIHPLALEMGINPYHLGAIFLTNLEIGYSTPPIGLNLFISSKTFKKHIVEIYKSTFPFLAILFLVLLIVTFVPSLSTWLLPK